MTIKGLYNRINKVDTDLVVQDALSDSAKGYVETQKEQMYEGINADGTERKPPYTENTIRRKQKKGQRIDVVTLKDKGDFYRGQFLEVRENTLVPGSLDHKTEALEKKYGKIFGLSTPYKNMFTANDLRPAFKFRIEAATGLKMKPK